MNSVQLIGNLGSDPELRHTKSGTAVCNLNVATNRTYTQNGSKKQETTWHDVVVWGKQAENCAEYLSKGRQVAVEGRIQTNEWTDNNGNKREDKEIVAHRVHFLSADSGGGRGGQKKTEPSAGNPQGSGGGWGGSGGGGNSDSFSDDHIPF